MKKFTTIAMALMLGGLGFTANAAGNLPEPDITPESGSTFYGSFNVPSIKISWNEEIVGINDIFQVSISYKGTAHEVDAEIESNGIFKDDEFIPEPPYSIIINWSDLTSDPDTWQTMPGDYTITVPAGVVKNVNGDINKEIVLNYTVYGAKGYEDVIPEAGEINWETWEPLTYKPSQLSDVTVVFDYKLEAVTPQLPVACILRTEDDDQGGIVPASAENGLLDPSLIKVDGNNIILDLSGLADGTWDIEIPAGFAKMADLVDTYTNEVEFTYIIKDGMGYPDVISGFQNYGIYTNLNLPEYALLTWDYSALELTGEGTVTVEVQNMVNFEQETIELPANAVVLRHSEPAQEGGEPAPMTRADEEVLNALEINFGEELPKIENASWLAIILPAGFVTDGNFVNERIELKIDVYPVYTGEVTFMNEDGDVSIYWGNNELGVNMDVDPAYISDTEGNIIDLTYGSPWDEDIVPDITEIMNDDWTFEGLIVHLNNLDLKDGSYTLWIPVGYVTIYPEDYSKMWYNNTVSWQFEVKDGEITGETGGVDSLESVKAIEGVYNLQGVKLSNDLNSLNPGLYIINGKKVIIRK